MSTYTYRNASVTIGSTTFDFLTNVTITENVRTKKVYDRAQNLKTLILGYTYSISISRLRSQVNFSDLPTTATITITNDSGTKTIENCELESTTFDEVSKDIKDSVRYSATSKTKLL